MNDLDYRPASLSHQQANLLCLYGQDQAALWCPCNNNNPVVVANGCSCYWRQERPAPIEEDPGWYARM